MAELREPEPTPEGRSPGGPPFGFHFFNKVFPERMSLLCPGGRETMPVVLLQLADDRVLDLCHIMLLNPQWMAVAVFRDSATCEEMDTVFLPYEMITRVTVTSRESDRRKVGFSWQEPALV